MEHEHILTNFLNYVKTHPDWKCFERKIRNINRHLPLDKDLHFNFCKREKLY